MKVTVLVFAVELHHLHSLWYLSEDWDEVQNCMQGLSHAGHAGGGRKHWKIRFYGIYIGISQLGRNMIKIKLKFHWKWFSTTSTIEASVRKLNSATRVTDTFNTLRLICISARRKKLQCKIPFTFLFDGLNFNSFSAETPGGGRVLGLSFARYVPLVSGSPYPIIVYSVANYRPHLSHFWANVIFAIPT